MGEATSQVQALEKLLETTRTESNYLRNGLQAEKDFSAYLHGVLQGERDQIGNLHHALLAEQAQVANLHNALQVEQAQVAKLEVQLALPSVDRALGRAARRLRETGDRLTGGGMRTLTNRVLTASLRRYLSFAARHPRLAAILRAMLKGFPRLATALSRAAPQPDSLVGNLVVADPTPDEPAVEPPPSDDPVVAGLPALARATYLKLQARLVRRRRFAPRPMRIVLDLQGAQSETSRFRGIGRYSLALAEAIAREAGHHDVWLALNGRFPDSIEPLRAQFAHLIPPKQIRIFGVMDR